jgi:hypothetical protein
MNLYCLVRSMYLLCNIEMNCGSHFFSTEIRQCFYFRYKHLSNCITNTSIGPNSKDSLKQVVRSSSEEENECGGNFPNPNCCYVHFSFIKFEFSLTKQVLDAHSSMLTTIFYMITPIVCPEPLLKVFFNNIYCLHVTLTTRGTKLG